MAPQCSTLSAVVGLVAILLLCQLIATGIPGWFIVTMVTEDPGNNETLVRTHNYGLWYVRQCLVIYQADPPSDQGRAPSCVTRSFVSYQSAEDAIDEDDSEAGGEYQLLDTDLLLSFLTARQTAVLWTSAAIPVVISLILLLIHRRRRSNFHDGGRQNRHSRKKPVTALCLIFLADILLLVSVERYIQLSINAIKLDEIPTIRNGHVTTSTRRVHVPYGLTIACLATIAATLTPMLILRILCSRHFYGQSNDAADSLDDTHAQQLKPLNHPIKGTEIRQYVDPVQPGYEGYKLVDVQTDNTVL